MTTGAAQDLRRLVVSLLEKVIEPLLDVSSNVRPFSRPTELRRLDEMGADLLDDIDEYVALASHYFDATVDGLRKSRPTDAVKKEIREIAVQARTTKKNILVLLRDLEHLLEELD